ncbi:G-type lectin S-receptor-like serine/threonine-protein kinase SD2-5 [Malania oleifera]|uniref:G-type lectin S-receptor-like serine/threonine-protein kinase SD2-5 n=1 Tax=Malania oleifera TaxID=397392 RepID=UPI0025AE994F|nr:G-type lectin S-receptor-like serine/threonine-protein kinase SD2-5 [Malania oleifera]
MVWSTNTASEGVTAMELQDLGNLVLLGNDAVAIWQSFSHPTNTLLPTQVFFFPNKMRLVSNPNNNYLSFYLELKSGDAVLYRGFQNPQPYWSLANDVKKIIHNTGEVISFSITYNSWVFFDQSQTVVCKIIFAYSSSAIFTQAAVLGTDGGGTRGTKFCQCLPVLSTYANCDHGILSPCNSLKSSVELVNAGDELDYFALGFLGSLQRQTELGSSRLLSYIKVSTSGDHRLSPGREEGSTQNHFLIVMFIVTPILLVVASLLCFKLWYSRKNKGAVGPVHDVLERDNVSSQNSLEEEDFL